jgi:hypothetical protein
LQSNGNAENAIELTEGEYDKNLGSKKAGTDTCKLSLVVAEVQLVLMEDEEDKDQEAVKVLIQAKKRVFRYLFSNYSNSGFSNNRYSSFDALNKKSDTISIAEIGRMLKEHNVGMKMLSHLEVTLSPQSCSLLLS